jgi:probable rRNA maturation factor
MVSPLSVINTTKKKAPRVPFREVAASLLPRSFELSLVFVGDAKAASLNKAFRGKTYRANVLTFPLSNKSGEIFINLDALSREAPTFDLSPRAYALLLFIHGCLHLKGVPHGARMERLEKRYLSKFLR